MRIPEETGKSLADYLQHERPAIRRPAVFVRQVAGWSLAITSCTVQKVIKCACRRIGLPGVSAHPSESDSEGHLRPGAGLLEGFLDARQFEIAGLRANSYRGLNR
jgi:hypothetical protein